MKAEFLRAGKRQKIEIEHAHLNLLLKRRPEPPFSHFDPEPKYRFALCWAIPGYGQTDLRGQDGPIYLAIYLTDAEFSRLAAKINQAVTTLLEEEH
ncbi:unnamed protein product [marine sediment metagenome]|uniref:Uncharacterized protein n=1 Tax=marine sediment metagenome TaxID=412755 RepID=X1J3H9_9ZZZZ